MPSLTLPSLLFLVLFNFAQGLETFQQKIIVNSSELCIIPVKPAQFNWEKTRDSINEIQYNARISQSPDLPEWLHYTYDGGESVGYIYGVPPKRINSMNLDVIGWNYYDNYDVRRLVLSMEIVKKDPLEFIIEMKIDNLNVRHLCSPRRMNMLLTVFRDELGWTMIDGSSVVPTFLASAVEAGENRIPLRPNDAEGVILHLSSDKDFSDGIKKLALEVSKLWKMRPCPRDMKRTSMERHFRKNNFLVDWCSFRMRTVEVWDEDADEEVIEREDGGQMNEAGEIISDNSEDEYNSEMRDDIKASYSPTSKNNHGVAEVFKFKQEIPERGYGWAALLSCIIPGSIGGLVGFLLIALLWVDREDDTPIDEDTLCFEAAYRSLMMTFKFARCSRQQQDDKGWETVSAGDNIIIVSRPDDNVKDIFDKIEDERIPTPLPPQYRETHPNGSPALIYAV